MPNVKLQGTTGSSEQRRAGTGFDSGNAQGLLAEQRLSNAVRHLEGRCKHLSAVRPVDPHSHRTVHIVPGDGDVMPLLVSLPVELPRGFEFATREQGRGERVEWLPEVWVFLVADRDRWLQPVLGGIVPSDPSHHGEAI
eukprot:scaffold128859_cov69-Phaeocystis_antarctica.AAC.3